MKIQKAEYCNIPQDIHDHNESPLIFWGRYSAEYSYFEQEFSLAAISIYAQLETC